MSHLLKLWLKIDPKRTTKTHIFEKMHTHEKFIGFPAPSLLKIWDVGSEIKNTLYEVTINPHEDAGMDGFFRKSPEEKSKEDIFWMINLRFSSSSLVTILTLLIEHLVHVGYSGLEHEGKVYKFGSFTPCNVWYQPKELFSVYFKDSKLLEYQIEPIQSWCRRNYATTVVLVSGDMVLDPSFGIHGYSILKSPYAFLHVKDYISSIPGTFITLEEIKDYKLVRKKELQLNGQSCIKPCLNFLKERFSSQTKPGSRVRPIFCSE